MDVATLTGAQLVALGTRTTGVMANDDGVREKVVAAAERAGEPSWGMPLPAELRKGLDSAVADIANISGERWGGMLVAGTFLKEFVPDGVKWAHLDIAAPRSTRASPTGTCRRAAPAPRRARWSRSPRTSPRASCRGGGNSAGGPARCERAENRIDFSWRRGAR
ncbi:hypothetical protein [Actinomadura madurae]|uniref:hypothetical protein n=1 Tax=Actinomadura madurae TaxID=1993 RepID=UPI003557A80D